MKTWFWSTATESGLVTTSLESCWVNMLTLYPGAATTASCLVTPLEVVVVCALVAELHAVSVISPTMISAVRMQTFPLIHSDEQLAGDASAPCLTGRSTAV